MARGRVLAMPRQSSRVAGSTTRPTPIHSSSTTPLSSAYPSTYASEDESDPEKNGGHMISISSLTLEDFNSKNRFRATAPGAGTMPFPFMSLPSELRIKIYRHHFAGIGDGDGIIDLDPDNRRVICKRLAIFRTCRPIYAEASDVFYSTSTFRVFPTHGRYAKAKKSLLARLRPHQRACIRSLELRLGPGWNRPARSWVVDPALGLRDCINVRSLSVFVQCDPSNDFFRGFRKADDFYENFTRALLDGVLRGLPMIETISFDACPSVKKSGGLMKGLLEVSAGHRLRITWGPQRGWTDAEEVVSGNNRTRIVPLVDASPTPALMGNLQSSVLVTA